MTTLAPNDFIHLHVHSEFSLLDGLGRITDLVDAASAQGFDSLALTDHGALYGAVAFYQAATTKGIKPIIGVETYVARRSMTDKEGKADAQPFHLILLAKDLTGYRNLCRLVTDAHIDGYYYKPRIDREHLAKHSEGLDRALGAASAARSRARSRSTTGTSPARSPASTATSSARTASSSSSRTTACPSSGGSTSSSSRSRPSWACPLVVTNDLHYVRREQHDGARRAALRRHGIEPRHAGPAEVRDGRLLPEVRRGDGARCSRTSSRRSPTRSAIAEMCDLELPLGQLRIPHFPVPDGETVESWLRTECERGLALALRDADRRSSSSASTTSSA